MKQTQGRTPSRTRANTGRLSLTQKVETVSRVITPGQHADQTAAHKQPSLPYQLRLAGIVPRFTGGGGLFLRE